MSILELQSVLFAALCGCVTLVLRIIQELWQSSGGVCKRRRDSPKEPCA